MKNTGWKKKISMGMTALGLSLSLTACGNMGDRLASIGREPNLSQIAINNPLPPTPPGTLSVPMPDERVEARNINSLWMAGRQTFFKDQRAHKVGDILTVLIEIDDKAEIDNETKRGRAGTESLAMPEFLGIPQRQLAKVFPEEIDPASLVNETSNSSHTGTGSVDRKEKIKVKVAATVTNLLPNGNFVISGRQEVRINSEVRELLVAGIIRPEDIANNNAIGYEKIAEARISYGGRGQITDMQQPRYGQQFWDIVSPF